MTSLMASREEAFEEAKVIWEMITPLVIDACEEYGVGDAAMGRILAAVQMGALVYADEKAGNPAA